jgi:glycosyltransferase involved in cell wall biosynthesis
MLKPKGGFDGLGAEIYSRLGSHFPDLLLLDKLNPPVKLLNKGLAKLYRTLHIPSFFPAFSDQRLGQIAQMVEIGLHNRKGLVFFHGATPWVDVRTASDYFIFTDCCYETYISTYHEVSAYSKQDTQRIAQKEKFFFEKATCVFFSSQWALDETKKRYGLEGKNFLNISQGPLGNSAPHSFPGKMPMNQFVFIGLDFKGKGGPEICKAFAALVEKFPGYTLKIIGERPPDVFLQAEGIEYLGYIDKSTAAGRALLMETYQMSKALLLLTQKDIAPVVIIESGMNGCPAIANRHCAIPEMIEDGVNGYLVGKSVSELFDAMNRIALMDGNTLMNMRAQACALATQRFSWDRSMGMVIEQLRLS